MSGIQKRIWVHVYLEYQTFTQNLFKNTTFALLGATL
jgi:hypothetical protein